MALDMRGRPLRLIPEEFSSTRYRLYVPPEVGGEPVEPRNLLDPKFWTHCAKQLKLHDEVRVICEDGSWVAKYFTRGVGQNEVHMAMIEEIWLDKVPNSTGANLSTEEKYEVKWGSPTVKYRVIRKSDGFVVKEGMSKQEAEQWAKDRVLVEAR